MKKVIMATVVLGLVLAVAGISAAQMGGAARSGQRGGFMARLDTDGDGQVSKQEWQRDEEFKRLDTDANGYISTAEFEAGFSRNREGGRAGGAQAQPGGPAGQRAGERAGQGPRAEAPGQPAARAEQAADFAGALFRLVDSDDNGEMSVAEIDAFSHKLSSADRDGDGKVTREEARETFSERAEQRGERFMERFDADKNGRVTREEFTGRPEAFERMDSDGDGVVTAEELQNRPAPGRGDGEGGRRGGRSQ